MGRTIKEKTLKLADLAKEFDTSIKLRKIYGLSNDKPITVKKIKPSGIRNIEATVKRHPEKIVVEIWDGDKLCITTDLKSHNEAIERYFKDEIENESRR